MSEPLVPAGWKTEKLAKNLKRVRNPVDVIPDKIYREIGIRSHGRGIFYKEERNGASLGNKSVFWIEPDCLILNIVFAWEQAITKTTFNEKGMIASHRFPMYKPIIGKLDLDFILNFFKTPRGKYLLGLASPGGAGRNKTLGQQAFTNLEIVIPPFVEQQKISTIINTWDEAIALTEKLIVALGQRKKGLMQRLLTGEVRFPGFHDDWQERKLKELVSINYGRSPKEIRSDDGAYPIFGTGGIVGNTDVPIYSKPSIIIGRKGSIDQPQLSLSPFWAIDTTFFCKPLSDIDMTWLYFILGYRGLARYNEGTSIPSISRNTLENIKISVPELSEQQKIANLLRKSDIHLSLYQRKIMLLQTQKKGLMQRLLTGQIRVNVN